jgi:multidrug efflux system membrane fusion protein
MSRPSPAARFPSLALALAVSACSAGATPVAPTAEPVAPTVRVAVAQSAPITTAIRATGRLLDAESRELGFPVGGRLLQVGVREGERVRRGQVLARLDAEPFDAQSAQADAALSKARRDQARAAALFGQGAVPQAPMDDAGTGLAVAEAGVRLARFQRTHTVLVAPDDGVVLRRLSDPGEVTGPGQPVLSLSTGRRGRVVRAALVDRDVVRVTRGLAAEVRLDALPGTVFTGVVDTLAAVPQPLTGLFEIEIALPNDAPGLPMQRGLVARVSLTPSARGEGVRVPLAALVTADADRGALFVLDAEDRPERRAVRLDALEDDAVWLVEGVRAGERFVVAGLERVVEGQRVSVTP